MTDTNGLITGEDGKPRCWWHGSDPLYLAYHDNEWGRPQADDRRLFEKLCLEGFQSGLSWLTILRKRENFRRAFAGFDPAAVTEADATTVAFGHCPFGELAESNPELVCALHRGLMEGFAGEIGGASVVDFHDLSHREPCRATLVPDR